MNDKDLKNVKIKRYTIFADRPKNFTFEWTMELFNNIEEFMCEIINWYHNYWINAISFNLDSERHIFKKKFLVDLKYILTKNKMRKEYYLVFKSLLTNK